MKTPLRIGVLGVSGHLLTRMMLPFSKSVTVTVTALASRHEEKAKKAALEWGVEKYYGSYEALLRDEEIDAVYIPLPNHMHLEWVKKAIDANKHVLCEKPLTLTAKDTLEIIEYAKEKEVVVMEAFMYRFHPKWQAIRELIKVKGIGDVHAIHTIFTYHNTDPQNIRNIKAFGGGALMDIGCYAISSARYILDQEPIEVLGLNSESEAFGTDVLSSGIMKFKKARALFTVATGTFPTQKVEIYGSSGYIEVTVPFNDYYDVPAQIKVVTGLGERVIEFEPTNQYGCLFDAFAQSVSSKTKPPVTLEDSYMNMQIIEKLLSSGDSHQWETINKL